MKNNNKKYSVKKTSNGTQSKELLKALQKIIFEGTGSVSYYFVDERIDNIHSHKMKDLNEVQKKSILHVNLSNKAVVDKSPTDLITMFETTKWDLGAKYFVVN